MGRPTKTHALTLRMSSEDRARLEALAQSRDVPASQLLRQALRAFLDQHQPATPSHGPTRLPPPKSIGARPRQRPSPFLATRTLQESETACEHYSG